MAAYRNVEIPCEDNSFYRIFEKDVDDVELVWHRDRADRECYVVDGRGWKIQFDNEMPFELKEGDTIRIKKMDYHRLIKGTTKLILKIKEYI